MPELDDTKITRFEVINHAKNDHPFGRMLTMFKELHDFDHLTISVQDGGRTLKIFLDSVQETDNA